MSIKSWICLLFLAASTLWVRPATAQSKADSVFQKTQDFITNVLNKEVDSSYIEDLRSELSLKLLGVFKYTSFAMFDKGSGAKLRYRPDRQINLGFGVAHKWFAIDLAFDVGIKEASDEIDSKFLNFTGKVFGRRQYIEATYQYYYGYQIDGVRGLPVDEEQLPASREDVRTVKVGLQYLYSFNYDRFSIQAPFILNEIQRKSAGSWLGGAQFSQYTMDGDSSVIPAPVSASFSPELQLRDINVGTLGANFGYMYSFVLKKKWFFTLGLIPAININYGDYLTINRKKLTKPLSLGYTTMNAFGYNSRRFFTGFQFSLTSNYVKIEKDERVAIQYGNAKFFLGWRFKTRSSRALENQN